MFRSSFTDLFRAEAWADLQLAGASSWYDHSSETAMLASLIAAVSSFYPRKYSGNFRLKFSVYSAAFCEWFDGDDGLIYKRVSRRGLTRLHHPVE